MHEDSTPATNPMTPSQAVATFNRIGKHGEEAWQDWLKLGGWIGERQALASAKAGHATRGSIYAAQLERQLGQFYPIYKRLSDSGVVSALVRCIESLDAIEAWRTRVPIEDRLNSPKRVWEAYTAQQAQAQRSDIDDRVIGAGRDPFQDMENPEDFEERERQHHSRKSNEDMKDTNKYLAAQVSELLHKIEMSEFIGDETEDAQRTWMRFVRMYGNDERLAAEHARLFCRKLEEIIALVMGEKGGLPAG